MPEGLEEKAKTFIVCVSWNCEDKAYFARCFELPSCTGLATDEADAVAGARQAIVDHLEYRTELGLSLPEPLLGAVADALRVPREYLGYTEGKQHAGGQDD